MSLPPWATELLKKAATVENTDRDPNARAKAVDRATQYLRTVIPEHFQEDAHGTKDRDQ
jgi:hypothetical protein